MKRAPLIILMLAAIVASFFVGERHGRARRDSVGPADTVTVFRTIYGEAPAPKFETLTRWAFFDVSEATETPIQAPSDTVREFVPVYVHDTLYLPITQRYYEEADGRLRLWLSGYQPSLDRWELDEKETTITRTKRVTFTAGAGLCVIYTPFHSVPVDAGPGVFGGIAINF